MSTLRTTLRLVLISDTHELHREVDVPDGDIFIHAGDFTMFSESMETVVDFNDWLGELPHPYKIVVPGNHEFFLEADPSRRFMLDNAIVLINEGTEVWAPRCAAVLPTARRTWRWRSWPTTDDC
jgi:predicted phosphohydrolase